MNSQHTENHQYLVSIKICQTKFKIGRTYFELYALNFFFSPNKVLWKFKRR